MRNAPLRQMRQLTSVGQAAGGAALGSGQAAGPDGITHFTTKPYFL